MASAAGLLATQAACGPEDKAVWLKPTDRSLDGAVAQARSTLPVFWRHLDDDPAIEDASVKIGFKSAHGGTEFLWVFVDSHSTDSFRGSIGSKPDDVPAVRAGEPYVGQVSEIVDWSYLKGGKGYGQFTSRELVKQGAFAEQASDLAPAPLEPGDR